MIIIIIIIIYWKYSKACDFEFNCGLDKGRI